MNQWIKCSDELPTLRLTKDKSMYKSEPVLCYTRDKTYIVLSYNMYLNCKEFWDSGMNNYFDFADGYITYWMPLPQCPT